MAVTQAQLEQLYLAYFGRPADFDGLVYYTTHTELDIWAVAKNFSESPESQRLYGTGFGAAQINAIYQNLFNRDAEPDGLLYWSTEVASGRLTAAGAAYAILLGAQNADAVAVANKLAIAEAFTNNLDTAGEITGYSGDAAAAKARAFLHSVSSDPATLTAALAGLDAAIAGTVGSGGTIGQTLSLTTGVDDIEITTGNTIDTVKALINQTADKDLSTLSVGDVITGNGLTVLQMTVAEVNTGTYSTPFVEATGIDSLKIINGSTGFNVVNIDGAKFGEDVSHISVAGAGMDLNVTDLAADESLEVTIASSSDVSITGSVNGQSVSISVTGDKGTTMTVGNVLTVDVAADAVANVWYGNSSSDDTAVTGDNVTLGDVNLSSGEGAEMDITVSSYAHHTGTAAAAATAGSITLGAVNIDVGTDSTSNEVYVYSIADSDAGAATAGSVTMGDVDITVGSSGSLSYFSVLQSAESVKGNATVGSLTIGNITVNQATSASSAYLHLERTADAFTSGNATVGDVAIGNVSFTGGDDAEDNDLYVYGYAYADKGNATVGSTTIGDLSFTLGNEVSGSVDGYLSISNSAQATTGVATIGNVNVGNIDMTVGTNAQMSGYVYNWASSGKGTAAVGTVTVGNVTGTAGLGGSIYGSVEATVDVGALATDTGTIGAVTVGNVTMTGLASADIGFGVYVAADTAGDRVTIGDVSVGDVSMVGADEAQVSYWENVNGKAVGNVSVGNLTLTAGVGGGVDWGYVSASATGGDVGNFTVGDVSITVGDAGYVNNVSLNAAADDNVGDVTVGNVSLTVGTGVAADTFDLNVSATSGGVGALTVGDVSVSGDSTSDVRFVATVNADESVGPISFGAVSAVAATGGYGEFMLDVNAADDLSTVDVGGISLTAAGTGAAASAFVSISAAGSDIGSVSLGDIALDVSGANAYAQAYASITGDTVGTLTIGDISVAVANTDAALTAALGEVNLSSGGAVVVGNISIEANVDATEEFVGTALANANVSISAGETLTVGDITVAGGVTNSASAALDTAGDLLSWLSLSGSTVTIGNVDYSNYAGASIIDVSGFKGASAITASEGGSVISDNATKNVIALGDGDDLVMLTNKSTLKADATVIDEIKGFESGSDVLETTLAGSDFVFGGTVATYAAFLTAAQNAMNNFDVEVYAAKVGTDTFVAFQKDATDNSALDFVVKLTGVSVVTAADFVIDAPVVV